MATKPQLTNPQLEPGGGVTHEKTQNSVHLKLIMYFDPEDQTFAIWDHNLTAEKALRELDRIRRKGLSAFTVEQRSRHKAEEAEDCGDSPADVEHAISAIPGHSESEPGSPNQQV